MDSHLVLSVAFGCAASTAMNIGKGVQKMKAHVLANGRAVLQPPHRRDFGVWMVGILLTLSAGILFMKALDMTDKPSVVSSLNGVGLIGLALFSLFALKENVGGREWGVIAAIILGTGLVQYFNVASDEGQHYAPASLMWSLAGCVGLSVAGILAARGAKKGEAFVYAAIAGACLGLEVIFFDVAGVQGGGGVIGMFRTPHFYIGFTVGILAMVMTNIAFFYGTGIVIVPTVNSFMIIVPMILEIFIFRVSLQPLQYAGAALIVAGVIVLTSGREKAALESKKPAPG